MASTFSKLRFSLTTLFAVSVISMLKLLVTDRLETTVPVGWALNTNNQLLVTASASFERRSRANFSPAAAGHSFKMAESSNFSRSDFSRLFFGLFFLLKSTQKLTAKRP